MNKQYWIALIALAVLASAAPAVLINYTQDGNPIITTGANATSADNLNADDNNYYNVTSAIGTAQVLSNTAFTTDTSSWTNSFEDNSPGDTNTFTRDTATFTSTPASGQKINRPDSSTQDDLIVTGTAVQTLNGGVDESTNNTLNWSMKFDSLTNAGNVDDAEVCAEVFGTIGGTANRRLYWCLVEDGLLPADTANFKYFQVGAAGTGWQNFSRNINNDIASKFGTTSFNLTEVRLVNRLDTANIANNAAEPVFTSHFDNILLIRAGQQISVTHYSTNNVTVPAGYNATFAQVLVRLKTNSTIPSYTLKWRYNGVLTTTGCSPASTLSSTEQTLNCTDTTNPALAIASNRIEANLVTNLTNQSTLTSIDSIQYQVGYPSLTSATLSLASDVITITKSLLDVACNASVDADFGINNTQYFLEWRPQGGNFTNMTTTSADALHLNASTPTNPYVNVSIPAGGSNETSWVVNVSQGGTYDVRCRIYSASAGQLYTSTSTVSVLNATHYEHLAQPNSVFNTTGPLGTLRTVNVSTTPFSGENLLATFDQDTTAGASGVQVSAQTITFLGWFDMITNPKRVRLNWQLVDYNPSDSTEIEICRTPSGPNGTLITKGGRFSWSGSCTLGSAYLVPSGNKLRVKIFVFNNVSQQGGSPTEDVAHMWDTADFDSKYSLGFIAVANATVSITEPADGLKIAVGQMFNSTCSITCNGTCVNTKAHLQLKGANETNFTDANNNTNRSIILNTGETNPHLLGTISGTVTTTFTLKGNLLSTNNTLRCQIETATGNATSLTGRNVTVSPSTVNTSQPTYSACGTVYYKFELWDTNDLPEDATTTITIYNTSLDIINETTTLSASGVLSGYFLLPGSAERGQWLLEALADGVLFRVPFLVGTGNTDNYRVDLSFSPNKAVYNSTETFTAAATVWNLKGNGVSGLSGPSLVIKIDNTNVGSITDQGNGTYVFNVSTSGLTINNQHYVDVDAGPTPRMSARKGFYVII